MNLITLNNISFVPNENNKPIVTFTVTIPKNSYFQSICIAHGKNLSTNPQITDSLYDIIDYSVAIGENDYADWIDIAFNKLYENDKMITYQLKTNFSWTNGFDSSYLNGIELDSNDIIFITLKLDPLTEAKYQADCSDSTLTFAVYDKEKMMADIVRYGRYLGDDCVSCNKVPDALLQKVIEYRMFNAALTVQDWTLAKNLFNKFYQDSQPGTNVSYTLTGKCNCNG